MIMPRALFSSIAMQSALLVLVMLTALALAAKKTKQHPDVVYALVCSRIVAGILFM